MGASLLDTGLGPLRQRLGTPSEGPHRALQGRGLSFAFSTEGRAAQSRRCDPGGLRAERMKGLSDQSS